MDILLTEARMDPSLALTRRLDSLPFSRWHLGMLAAIGTVWIFDGYQVSLVSLFSKLILNEHSETEYKSLANAYMLGTIVGSVVFGLFAYYRGRRSVFMITLGLYAVGVLLSVLGSLLPLFLLGRLFVGISVGGEFTAIFTAIDEFLPPRVRGRVDIIVDGTWHLGGVLACVLSIAIGEVKEWRLLFVIGFIGVLGLACIRRNIPQSPRWLIMKGRHQEAQIVVDAIEESVLDNNFFLTARNVNTLNEQPQHEPNPKSSRIFDPSQPVPLGSVHSQPIPPAVLEGNNILQQFKMMMNQYKSRLFLSCFLIFSQGFYFSSVYYQFPLVLSQELHMQQHQISLYMLALSICCFVSVLLVGPCFDTCGRKIMLLTTYSITGILLPFSYAAKSSPIALLLLTCLMFMFGSPASSAANLIASQIFPTSTRPIVLSLIFNVGMLGSMAGVWMNNYYVTGGLMVAAGLLGWWCCPSAEGKSLEEINRMGGEGDDRPVQI